MSDAGHTERLEAALDGKYRIERKLGEGGMASVYLAEDVKHKRNVALKILRPELAAVIGSERFLAEIQTTANLQHPHILPLFDSGEADGYLYYVMPYIDGETLREKLDREKQLGVDEAVRIARDVADALDYAHRAGVIHRDIKPGNILLHDGRPVVADFGIALAVSAAGGGRMTETGLSLGTPHYMSPEQASADRDLSARSDVYSLGCVLYEMIGGQPPHTGPSAQSILVHILTEEARPLSKLRHTVPPHVAATVARAIEKLPADRFESAKDFMEALGNSTFSYEATSRTVAVPEPVATTAGRTTTPWMRDYRSVVLLVFTVGMTLLALSSRIGPPPQPTPATRALIDLGGLSLSPEDEILVSPDGSRFAVTGTVDGVRAIYWRDAGDERFRVLPGTEGAGDGAALSPDGDWLVYVSGTMGSDGLFKISFLGGAPTPVVPPGETNPRDPHWADDGTIVFVSDAGLHRVPDTGGEPVLFGEPGLNTPSVLPGGGGVLAARGGGGIMLVDPESDSVRELLPGGFDPRYVETGHIIYVDERGGLWAFAFDADRAEVLGEPVPLLDGLSVYPRGDLRRYARLSVSRNGTLTYAAGGGLGAVGAAGEGRELVVVDLRGREQVLPLAPRPIPALGVGWSPDGESIVFESGGQIYTYNVVLNTAPRQITFEGGNTRPVFSPDGARVAFSSNRDGTDGLDLFVKDLNDDSPPRSILRLEANQFMTQWPMDTLMVFERGESGVRDLWMVDVSDPENPEARPYLTSEADLQRITVSPDGALAAYRSDESGQDQLYVRSFPTPGERTVVSSEGGGVPAWSPDGNTLYYFIGSGRPVLAATLRRDPVPVLLSTDTLFIAGTHEEPFPGSVLHPAGDRFILSQVPAGTRVDQDADAVGSERFVLVTNWFTELRARMGEN